MARVGHPHRCEFSRTKEPGQADRVPSIGFHPISRLPRDQRRGHDDAGVPHAGDQAMEAIAGRAGFVAELRPGMLVDDALDQPAHAVVRGVHLSHETDLAVALPIGGRDSVPRLGDIDPQENFCRVLHGSSFYGEARLGPPEQPSDA